MHSAQPALGTFTMAAVNERLYPAAVWPHYSIQTVVFCLMSMQS